MIDYPVLTNKLSSAGRNKRRLFRLQQENPAHRVASARKRHRCGRHEQSLYIPG